MSSTMNYYSLGCADRCVASGERRGPGIPRDVSTRISLWHDTNGVHGSLLCDFEALNERAAAYAICTMVQ
ncbi:hypothetical protein X777_14467 [Ooceraea biroi]|uniref:Uncharacterized protein n=1 Tax=Ooceraea biroi TaxID=2015173 RepID=A0A026VWF4_OOCBI|nr:hypothetical protein X777_14467 [Ooceraea biroi]